DAAPLREALAGIGPITATLGKTSLFENDDADVVKVDIDSPDLRRVREAIATVIDAPGDTRGDYVPHATVAYVKPGQGQKYAGDATLEGQTIAVDRIAFTTRDGQTIEIPLGEAATPTPKRIDAMTEAEYVEATSAGTHVFDSLYRSGPSRTDGMFLARSPRDLDGLGNAGDATAYHGVQFDNPLVTDDRAAASLAVLGRNVYEGIGKVPTGEVSARSRAILAADSEVGKAASAQGYDAIVTPGEVQVLDPAKLPEAEPMTGGEYEGIGFDKRRQRSSSTALVDTAPPPAQTGTRAATRPEATAREGAPGDAGTARPADGPPRRRDATRARAARDVHPNPDRAPLFAATLEAARALKPDVDTDVVRREFDARHDLVDDIRDEEDLAGADPRLLLREIAKRGGLFEKDDGMGQAGELRRLREGQAFGKVGGVNGVLAGKARQLRNVAKRIDGKLEIRKERRGGLPLDVMLQDLQADGRFPWLESIDDLTNFLDDVQKHGVPDTGVGLSDLGISPNTAWWETPVGPQAETEADTPDVDALDDTFNPAVYEPRPLSTESIRDAFGLTDEQAEATLALADAMGLPLDRIEVVQGGESDGDVLPQGLFDDEDILDTGERQARLPGDVGQVRDEERPTPKLSDIEDEFRLTPQFEKRKGVQRALFQMKDGSPLPLYQPAWHGSPHVFDEFSLHKIGTGEGAQAYGWGLYFAGNKAVAQYYREQLAGGLKGWQVTDEARRLFERDYPSGEAVIGKLHGITAESMAGWVKSQLSLGADIRAGIKPDLLKAMQASTPGGRLYKVDIPEDGDYLDWDKPLSEQSAKVRAMLERERHAGGFLGRYAPSSPSF
ncbi:MAG: 2'-5' RNA ligase family protein, partial [Acidobacteria bacterium]|nr:2'-5' RNA ligase family protein [Acidobacteriota bacterium]